MSFWSNLELLNEQQRIVVHNAGSHNLSIAADGSRRRAGAIGKADFSYAATFPGNSHPNCPRTVLHDPPAGASEVGSVRLSA